MKFLCRKCDEGMKLVAAAGPEEGSMTVSFACPSCGNEVAMLTNPEETNLVRALGVQVGGMAGPPEPMAHVRATLSRQRSGAFVHEGNGPIWTQEATERLERVPSFARAVAKKRYEDFATQRGMSEITPQVMDEAREFLGQ